MEQVACAPLPIQAVTENTQGLAPRIESGASRRALAPTVAAKCKGWRGGSTLSQLPPYFLHRVSPHTHHECPTRTARAASIWHAQ
eukprot:2445296-Amphidinium_carterae.1